PGRLPADDRRGTRADPRRPETARPAVLFLTPLDPPGAVQSRCSLTNFCLPTHLPPRARRIQGRRMAALRRPLWFVLLLSLTGIAGVYAVVRPAAEQGGKGEKVQRSWIWLGDKPQDKQTVYFRKEIVVKHRVTSARLYGPCDNQMTVFINGTEVI